MKTKTKVHNRDFADILEAGRNVYDYQDTWGRYKHRLLFENGFNYKLIRLILSKVPKNDKTTPLTESQREYSPRPRQSRWAELVYGKLGRVS